MCIKPSETAAKPGPQTLILSQQALCRAHKKGVNSTLQLYSVLTRMSLNRSSRLNNKTLYSLPVHCLSDADIRMEHERGIMQGFHRPENSSNRFMASLTAFGKSILREIERPEPYNSKLLNRAPAASKYAECH